jgi:hypothetical protein
MFLVSANTILHIVGILAHAVYILNSFLYKPWFCCLKEDTKAVFTDLTAILVYAPMSFFMFTVPYNLVPAISELSQVQIT